MKVINLNLCICFVFVKRFSILNQCDVYIMKKFCPFYFGQIRFYAVFLQEFEKRVHVMEGDVALVEMGLRPEDYTFLSYEVGL